MLGRLLRISFVTTGRPPSSRRITSSLSTVKYFSTGESVLGVGRLYLGYNTLGLIQLIGGLLFGIVTCGFGFIVPVVWGIVDAVLILTDKVRDPVGRPLRDAV